MDCPDSDDFEGPDKNQAVTVENLAADRKSFSLKIKATLFKQYGKEKTHVSSSKEKSTTNYVPEEVNDEELGNSEKDKQKEQNSKAKDNPHPPFEDIAIEEDDPSETLMDVEVNEDVIENSVHDGKSSTDPVPLPIDLDSIGFAPPNCDIAELIDKIASAVYKCNECDIELSDYKEWKHHLHLHGIDVTNFTEAQRSSLGESMPELICVICGWKGKRKGGLQVHLRSHESDVACDVCGMMFKKVKELKIHMRYHDVTEHQCDICKKSFLNNNSLVRHIATHSTTKLKRDRHELLCEICSRIFHAPNLLALHLKTHTNQSGFRCENCDITFKRRSLYEKHLENIHDNNKDSIVCRFCKTQYDTKDELTEHMMQHIGERTFRTGKKLVNLKKSLFKCTLCDKVIKRKSQFDAHMRIHTGQKPFMCDICGVGFRVAGSLKKHQLVHSGDKPLECQYCGKCFAYTSSLTRHLQVHTDGKPYSCKTCGERFRAASDLKTHQQVHKVDGDDDQGRTSCPICHKLYRNIENHMKSHYKYESFEAKFISRVFGASASSILQIPDFPSTDGSITSKSKKTEISFPEINSSKTKDHETASESIDDTPINFSRGLTANKSTSQDISDDDAEGFIGFDDDDDDDNDANSITSHGYVSLSGKSDDNPNSLHSNLHTPEHHSELDENSEDTNTNHTTEIEMDVDKTQEVADQSEDIHTKLCQVSEMLENTLETPVKNTDIRNESESPETPATDCGRKLQSTEIPTLKLNDKNNEEIKTKKDEKTDAPALEEADFDEGEDDDDTGQDSIIQNAISHLDNLMEEMNNDESIKNQVSVVTKPKKRGKNQRLCCHVCGDVFKTSLAYETHLQIHSTSDVLSEDIIWDFFENSDGMYNCKKCDKKCKTKGTAFVHSKFHLGIDPFTCEICEESFQLADLLKKHYLCHGTYKPFKCQYCNRGFNVQNRLKRHLLTHENARNYMCHTCGGKFNTADYLRAHMKIHGASGEEKNRKQRNRYKAREKRQCPICGKVVKELELHLKIHSTEKKFQCSHCDKSFTTAKILHKHIKIHTGIKKFVCQYASCGKAFMHKSDFNRHEMIHEKRKAFNTFKCDQCVAVYSNEADLEKHLKLHKSSKWSCDICNRVFEKQYKLIAHALVHTREKPHKCDLCKAAFTQKGTLQRHVRERHSKRVMLHI